MKENMTHDDILNKEIEEEHAFMKARIKELENKSTYPFNEAFNKQLQEENQKLKELNNALSGQLNFVKSELELRLSTEIKRSKFILGEFKKTDKQRDYWRETTEKYKQALDEIEKTANKNFTHTAWEEYKEQLMQILDIINKTRTVNNE